ncbi:aminomethyltransferase [Trichosporon asahii var. asahii CBS 8904]|uniref:Aminomethyltransferase n=1 Tax=Trichosporon asahii var. asahii (strain CBS 8904) TaxID=1220162 RepID=K1VHW1_TRIAC|nr:aminomethyltransferase [Trichosporon asahii var. asahii CBS 8904]
MLRSRAATAIARTQARPVQGRLVLRGFASTPAFAEETPLYDFNVSRGGKMVPFAGFSMPLSYGDVGQVTAHKHVRSDAGLFDVSHMLQHIFSGPGATAFLESLTPTALSALPEHGSSLTVLLNDEGGIIDDSIMTRHPNGAWYVVTNAGRIDEDVAHIKKELEKWEKDHPDQKVEWKTLDGYGLVALQGPKAAEELQKLTDYDLSTLKFGQSTYANVGKDKVRCHIARGGYTGEDGFEQISIPPEAAVPLTEEITALPSVELIGLGARDSLRLEAGMCLYGHDLNESISPIEGALAWLVSKDRRTPGGMKGSDRILRELKEGPARRRVGLEIKGSPAREGSKIFDTEGNEIGVVTSGIPSPTLGTNIAMGYVKNGSHKKGTPLKVEVRKKLRDATVRPMPFVPAKYYK